jgi:hypothetical protein
MFWGVVGVLEGWGVGDSSWRPSWRFQSMFEVQSLSPMMAVWTDEQKRLKLVQDTQDEVHDVGEP